MALDPENHALHRLFLFWDAYDQEFKILLEEWHKDAVRNRREGNSDNILWDSFLDTWGKGTWDEVKDDSVPFEKRSWVQALGVVSHQLMKQCRNVLNEVLVSQGDGFRPFEPKPGIDINRADAMAQAEIDKILRAFNHPDIPQSEPVGPIQSLKNIDEKMEQERDRSPDNCYLNALLRMMRIETRCFEIQQNFLDKGTILPPETA